MDIDPGRILAVDPGDKRLGIAISDPTQIIASSLCVIEHKNRKKNAEAIYTLAQEHNAVLILIGQPLDWDGALNPQSNKSIRLAEEIQTQGDIPVKLWDEYGSTRIAQDSRRQMGVSRKKRHGHLDQVAAAVILQTFLDHQIDQETG
jgi:putative Holliday junction resolvase